jgi:hypothetical protein
VPAAAPGAAERPRTPSGAAAARGDTGVDEPLRLELLEAIRTRLSPRHVPDQIHAIHRLVHGFRRRRGTVGIGAAVALTVAQAPSVRESFLLR